MKLKIMSYGLLLIVMVSMCYAVEPILIKNVIFGGTNPNTGEFGDVRRGQSYTSYLNIYVLNRTVIKPTNPILIQFKYSEYNTVIAKGPGGENGNDTYWHWYLYEPYITTVSPAVSTLRGGGGWKWSNVIWREDSWTQIPMKLVVPDNVSFGHHEGQVCAYVCPNNLRIDPYCLGVYNCAYIRYGVYY